MRVFLIQRQWSFGSWLLLHLDRLVPSLLEGLTENINCRKVWPFKSSAPALQICRHFHPAYFDLIGNHEPGVLRWWILYADSPHTPYFPAILKIVLPRPYLSLRILSCWPSSVIWTNTLLHFPYLLAPFAGFCTPWDKRQPRAPDHDLTLWDLWFGKSTWYPSTPASPYPVPHPRSSLPQAQGGPGRRRRRRMSVYS